MIRSKIIELDWPLMIYHIAEHQRLASACVRAAIHLVRGSQLYLLFCRLILLAKSGRQVPIVEPKFARCYGLDISLSKQHNAKASLGDTNPTRKILQ